MNREEALKVEPNLSPEVLGALYDSKTGHCNPKYYVRAVYKRCIESGVDISLG